MTTAADTLGADLYRYLVDHMYDVEPARRRRSCWVMNPEWRRECERLALRFGGEILLPGTRQTMLGLPVLPSREDGGVPHLELMD